MRRAKKILLVLISLFLIVFSISCSTSSTKTATWITVPIVQEGDLSYLEQKSKALEACGFKNFSPFVLGIERTRALAIFTFFAKDIDGIARVSVDCKTGKAEVIKLIDQVTKNGFDFLKNSDLIIDAEKALNIACQREAKVTSPTTATPAYTYSSRFTRFKDPENEGQFVDAFDVKFGTKGFEYVFTIKAAVGDNVVLGTPKINTRADDRVIN